MSLTPSIGKIREYPVALGTRHPVVGIVTEPAPLHEFDARPAFILSNSGMLPRVGPGRLYVRLARRLATHGFLVARIDHRGIGDSPPRHDETTFYPGAVEEARETMDDLAERYGLHAFVIMGICSGAEVSFRTACADPRVAGAVLMNGGGQADSRSWHRHVQNRRWARHYWRRALFSPEAWARALRGRIQYRRLLAVLRRQLGSTFGHGAEVGEVVDSYSKQVRILLDRQAHLLLIHSAGDPTIEYRDLALGRDLEAFRSSGFLQSVTLAGADHTFNLLRSQERLVRIIEAWATTNLDRRPPTAATPERSDLVEQRH